MANKKLVICEEIEQVLEVTQMGNLTQTKYVYVRDYAPPDTQGALVEAFERYLKHSNTLYGKYEGGYQSQDDEELIKAALTRPSREAKDDVDNKSNDR